MGQGLASAKSWYGAPRCFTAADGPASAGRQPGAAGSHQRPQSPVTMHSSMWLLSTTCAQLFMPAAALLKLLCHWQTRRQPAGLPGSGSTRISLTLFVVFKLHTEAGQSAVCFVCFADLKKLQAMDGVWGGVQPPSFCLQMHCPGGGKKCNLLLQALVLQ